MGRVAARLNLLAGLVFLAALVWVGVVTLGPGALRDLFILHRGAPEPVAASSGPSGTSRPAGDAAAVAAIIPPQAGAGLRIPVAGVRPGQLLDTFTQARAGGARRHDAIDIPAPLGTAVLAAAPGTVEKLFLSRDGGNTVYVRLPGRLTIHYYAHLDGYAPGLREGQAVAAGQVLGRVGFSGNANPAAPHLHFAIWQVPPDAPWYAQGTAINPYPLLVRR